MQLLAHLLLQHIFNHVVIHAFKMTGPCRDDGRCLYRLDQTASCPERCFIGALISDEHYSPALEGGADATFPAIHAALAASLEVPVELIKELGGWTGPLKALQVIHDSFVQEGWESYLHRRFAVFATKYNLVYTKPSPASSPSSV